MDVLSKWKTEDAAILQLGCYLRYQFAACLTLSYAFSGQEALPKDRMAGPAVRVASEALELQEQAAKLALQFDKAAAAIGGKKGAKRPSKERLAFEQALNAEVGAVRGGRGALPWMPLPPPAIQPPCAPASPELTRAPAFSSTGGSCSRQGETRQRPRVLRPGPGRLARG